MSKKRIIANILSYGKYKKWDKTNNKLPELLHITDTVEAIKDIEFGYIINIKGAKGKTIDFIIDHPPFKNQHGEIEPPFTGQNFIDSNDYNFYLGDCIWEPIEDKTGNWTMITMINEQIIAKKTIKVVLNQSIETDFDW